MKAKMVLVGISYLLIFSLAGCATIKGTIKGTTETIYSGEKSVADYENVLEQNPNGVFANRNGEQIRTQIISFQFIDGNKVYFCTGSEKPFYEQLLKFPYVSYCTYPDDFEPVLSLSGKVVFSDDSSLKERAFNGSGYASMFVRNHYKNVDNPNLKLFYIDVDEIEIYDSDGARAYRTK